MADRRPLVTIAGRRAEMPTGDKLPVDVIPVVPAVTQRTFAFFTGG